MERVDDGVRARAVASAQGHGPFDVLLTGGTVVDVATMELRPADVGIVGPLVASVHPPGTRDDAAQVHDVSGRFVAPGFIDSHVHFESTMVTPENYAAGVILHGTTTIFCDPHELANVRGLDGVRYAVEASRDLPVRFIFQAPSCVPPAPGLELSGADFLRAELEEMLRWPEMAGVAEVMDMRGVLAGSDRMLGIVTAGLESGKLVEGHAFGLAGQDLQAYLAAGIDSDHEITSGADALEKLRAGMTVELRGTHEHVLEDVAKAILTLPSIPASLTICTDDVRPHRMVESGSVDFVLRRLVGYGWDPVQAIRCATINSALRLRRGDLGLVGAGRRADLVILSDLPGIVVEDVFVSGRQVVSKRRLTGTVIASRIAPPLDTVKVDPLDADSLRVRVPGLGNGRAVVRVISGARFTEWKEREVEVRDGHVVVPPDLGIQAAIHRHGRIPAQPHTALISDWGRWTGAIATTVSHDTHNLVVFGHDPADLAVAANALIRSGGGMSVAKDGKLLAIVELPVAGLLSAKPLEKVAAELEAVIAAADGVAEWLPPNCVFQSLLGTCLACNPGPHLTDLGLADGTEGRLVDAIVRTAAGRSS